MTRFHARPIAHRRGHRRLVTILCGLGEAAVLVSVVAAWSLLFWLATP